MSIKSLNFLINIIAVIILLGVEIPVLAQHIESSKIQNESNEDNHADFKISLAQWSLHNSIFGSIKSIDWYYKMIEESPDSLYNGEIDPMEFPTVAAELGIYSIELTNTFYLDKAEDMEYFTTFKLKCDSAKVKIGLIMCNYLGRLGQSDSVKRIEAINNHYKWIDIAEFLEAHSIRVNLYGPGSPEEVAINSVKSLIRLGKYGESKGINILVENHGGHSSDGLWLSEVIKKVGMKNVGTLPDFGNFCTAYDSTGCIKRYDRYKGMKELMPYAKAVSAKSYEFDDNGNETSIDYFRMMKIVKESGYKGYIGIEYEGKQLSELEGIKATKLLLEKAFRKL